MLQIVQKINKVDIMPQLVDIKIRDTHVNSLRCRDNSNNSKVRFSK